jgi:hypothetical protein
VLYEGNLTRVSPIHSTVLREFNGQSGGERGPGGVGETNFLLKKRSTKLSTSVQKKEFFTSAPKGFKIKEQRGDVSTVYV